MYISEGLAIKKVILFIVLMLIVAAGVAWAKKAEEWFEKGNMAMSAGYNNVAIRFFKKAIEIDPNYLESYINIGLLYNKEGDTKKAISYYEKAIAVDPDFTKAHYNLGVIYAKKGKLDKAISEFKRCISIDPDYAEVYSQLGTVYLSKGLDSEAADHFYRAGLLFLKQGDKESALKAYEGLKQTKSKELERNLSEKLNPKSK
ncbi:MAG: tetratricopeptide repeat protein [Deltaproteobacteria bacterium]|nr:tetratricopeptide repeat protein [Deltaproteobacteria bacterium]